jgi:MFS-type transporter involved in bile tolerance (Atg22 family)
MLEILALIYLTRHVGEIVESKGRKAGWFKVMTVMLWLGCEIGGGIIGAIIATLTSSTELLAYLFALIGAAVGAGVAIIIAKSLSPLTFDQPPPPPTSYA